MVPIQHSSGLQVLLYSLNSLHWIRGARSRATAMSLRNFHPPHYTHTPKKRGDSVIFTMLISVCRWRNHWKWNSLQRKRRLPSYQISLRTRYASSQLATLSIVLFVHCLQAVMYGFLQGDFGPFNPSMHTKVPLWLAINLKQRHKCRIEAPSWLCVGEYVPKHALAQVDLAAQMN